LRFARRVDDPRRYAGYVLLHLLRGAGVAVPGEVSLGGAAETRQLTYIESAPLAVLLRRLGKESDNFYAEMTLKALGAIKRPHGARSEDGAAAVLAWMNEIGAASSTTRIVNGSGLFDANRVSARGLAVALRHAYTSPRIGPDFVAQLAIGGVDGTLRSRLAGHRDRRVVRAKTGTLARSHALSGYVLAPPGKSPVAFSLLVDGVAGQHFEARRHLDGCVEAIVRRLWGGGP
jgi:D-alanyl-D-alanine carboxypeptidase/D-alanyl-D-alanine-endopeptidase (penicillin-binding protein 4)